jgi:asparagine synthase (glutamine-hydrolysing)
MCGICGFSGGPDPALLDRMVRRLEHRGPDEEGLHSDAAMSLGVRRLRVIDPIGGHQPIGNETGTVWAVLNGEIYNYRELRNELVRKGHRFASASDTEVLVHLYEQEGEEAVRRLRGMFAYAIWDQERQTLLLARDRFGIKPLYYTMSRGRLAFASEMPALLPACPSPSVRPQAIADYLALLYIPGPETIFEGIRELPPGHLLKLAGGRADIKSYVALQQAIGPVSAGDLDERPGRFVECLRDSVRAHLVSDVPLGLFLSGGLDSGSILAMVRSVCNGPIRTFSIGYDDEADRSYNELEAARLMADHFGAQHTEERIRPDAVKLLPRIVTAMAEPFADASAIPTFLVSDLARRSVTVALSGIGGDELFGGYPRYLGLRLARRYGALPFGVRRWLANIAPWVPEGSRSQDPFGRVKRFLRDGHRSLPEQYLKWITFLPSEWGASALSPTLREHVQVAPVGYLSRFERWPSTEPADQAMGLDLQTYLPDDLLRMGDRLSMAHSLELRVPFCDEALLAFALAVPARVRFSGGRLEGFMRQALAGHLPAEILRRPKAGFQVPLARWIRQDLREMVRDVLSPTAIRRRGYVQPHYVEWLLCEHEQGRRNLTDQIYALLVLELWSAAVHSQ